jgi:hypothetical protein
MRREGELQTEKGFCVQRQEKKGVKKREQKGKDTIENTRRKELR